MAADDLAILSDDLRSRARVDTSGEVAWHIQDSPAVLTELADAGRVLLGLDLRDYDDDGSGLEVPWSVYEGEDPVEARIAALRVSAVVHVMIDRGLADKQEVHYLPEFTEPRMFHGSSPRELLPPELRVTIRPGSIDSGRCWVWRADDRTYATPERHVVVGVVAPRAEHEVDPRLQAVVMVQRGLRDRVGRVVAHQEARDEQEVLAAALAGVLPDL